MHTGKLNKTLAFIDCEKSQITDSKVLKIFSRYLNLLEELYAENQILEQENQKIKDEINKLKGEQGKPNIKGDTSSICDFSTDADRRNAEKSNDKISHGYKLNKFHLEKLGEHEIPDDILKALEVLSKKKFSSEDEFLGEVKCVIGEDACKKYEEKLLKYAFYKKRQRKPKIPNITITREKVCDIDKNLLPKDAVFTTY